MDPQAVTEFQCIMPLENTPFGAEARHTFELVSGEAAASLCRSRGGPGEARRQAGSRRFEASSYNVNPDFHARNPMMSKRRDEASSLCVLRIRPEIVNVEGVTWNRSKCWRVMTNGSAFFIRASGLCWTLIGFSQWIGAIPTDSNITTENRRNALKSSCRTLSSHAFLSVPESPTNPSRSGCEH